jgi:hypothetical protein
VRHIWQTLGIQFVKATIKMRMVLRRMISRYGQGFRVQRRYSRRRDSSWLRAFTVVFAWMTHRRRNACRGGFPSAG